ncbi:hypothetical protein Tco_1514388 [Tanacetum coccineum]
MSLSLAENVIVAGADNRPMLDNSMYSSWASRMILYIKGKEYGKLLVDSVLNGPFQYGTVTELDIYNLVNHHEEAKDIWDRVKLLIEGSEISVQEKESKLYDEFDTFTLVPGETIHSYYMRQHEAHSNETQYHQQQPSPIAQQYYSSLTPQQLRNISLIKQPPYQAQVSNTPTVVLQQSYQAPNVYQSQQASYTPMDSGLVVPSFLPSDDLIASLNKAITFINTTFTSRYLPTNNQLRTSSNPRNQATIQDGRVSVQTVQGRQNQGYSWNGRRSNATAT